MNKKLLYLILIPMIISCSNMMNPMYLYYNRTKSSSSQNTNEVTTPDAVDKDKDPFIQGDHNNIDYGGFNGNVFNTWLFKVSFQKDKLPIYNFFTPNNNRTWLANGKDWKGNYTTYYDGDKNENIVYGTPIGDKGIENLKIYKYDKYNPLYDSKGYLSGRMDRFKFYSIDGKAVIDLKQYLIAVDTYSKFIFAYGAITKVDSTLGNKYPTDFDAIEFYAKKIHFYEYDPIGYVTDNGKVVLYDHYIKEFVANPTGYYPQQHGYDKVAVHNPSGHGYSPYKPINNNNKEFRVSIEEISIKNIDSQTANRYALKDLFGRWNAGDIESIYDYANIGSRFKIALYNNESSKDIEIITDEYPDKGASINSKYKIKMGEKSLKSINKKDFIFEYKDEDEIFIDLYFDIVKYDEPMWGSTLEWSYYYVTDNKICIKLKYNKNTNKLVYYSHSDHYNNRLILDNINISINENEIGEIKFQIDGQDGELNKKCGSSATGLNNKIEISYKLKFNKLK